MNTIDEHIAKDKSEIEAAKAAGDQGKYSDVCEQWDDDESPQSRLDQHGHAAKKITDSLE